MGLNELPEGFEGEQKRQTKLDDNIPELQAEITKQQTAIGSAIEAVELDPRLKTFKADFDSDPELQAKISWEEIQTRLLVNDGHYLALAQAMEQGGQLFGVDAKGNPLISDRGDEPIMCGMNFKKTRDRVLYKHDRLDKAGKRELDEDKKPIVTGYEMFPYVEPSDKSPEILQYEAHTGKPFVKSPNGDEYRSSWLELGKHFTNPFHVYLDPRYSYTRVYRDYKQSEFPTRGVRRLLRVKKA